MTTKQSQAQAKQSGARFAPVCEWHFTAATIAAANKINPGTVAEQSQALGMRYGDALIVIMDALYQYASVYAAHFEGKLAQDSILGAHWLDAAKGVRGLLNGDGTVAMARDITTDTKDNGVLETVFWEALNVAGFSEEDI